MFVFRRSFPSLSGGGNRAAAPKPKKAKRTGVQFIIQPKETWTHDFCLLSSTIANTSPTISNLARLKDAGLGRTKVTFPDKNANFCKLKEALEKEYEKLKSQDGAFEFLRAESGGSVRPLKVITMPADGYTIPYMRNVVSNNTLIYIRPMKSNISMDFMPQVASGTSPSTQCQKCSAQVPLVDLRKHMTECGQAKSVSNVDKIELSDTESDSGRCVPLPDVNQWTRQLHETFPAAEEDDIRNVAQLASNIDDAALILMDMNQEMDEEKPFADIIEEFISKVRKDGEEFIEVDRETVWADVIKYYKKTLSAPDRLKKELMVRFANEDGLDGGALKVELFTIALREAKLRLFEGEEPNMIPIKDATKLILFRLVGMMVSHSIIQKASIGFPVLSPYIYSYLTGDSEEEITCKMNKETIPKNAATSTLHDLLDDLILCEDEAALNGVLEGNPRSEAYWTVINSSHWPKEQAITMSNKDLLIQQIIFNELLSSRKHEIDEFREGLESIGILQLIQKHKKGSHVFLCSSGSEFSTADLQELMKLSEPKNFSERQASEWLMEYINEQESDVVGSGGPRACALLQFCTGWQVVPLGGLQTKIKVTYLADDDCYKLPTTSACLAILRIPTVHSTKKKFFEAMDIALKFERMGFPNP